MPIYLNGLILGLSLVSALGPQNIFLIKQGAQKNHILLSTIICFVCDGLLVAASITGLHHALMNHPALQSLLTWFGVLFLLYYGTCALNKGLKKPSINDKAQVETSNRLQIILLALSFSLLNPHAIIDSLIIIGGGSSQFPDHPYLFLMGVLTASALWLSTLMLITHYFSDILTRTTVWQRIELSSGLLMLFLSLKLACHQV